MRLLYAFNKFIFFLFVTGFFVNNVYSQCDPPFDIPFSLVELDSTINYTFTSSVTGVDFIQPLYLNLPLCPEYAEEGAGCTQVELPTVDYNGLGLGYSGAFLQVFWRDIWENQVNVLGDLISIDSDNDGCFYDNTDDPYALVEYGISEDGDDNPFYEAGWSADWNGDGTMDFTAVIIYYCEDDLSTSVNEEENICSCNVEFFSINESDDFQLLSEESDASCYNFNDGSITTTSTGGQGPFLYNWDIIEDSFSDEGLFIDEGQNIENLPAGTYTLTVEDTGVPCTYVYDFILSEPDSFYVAATVATDPSCFGLEDGVVSLDVSGGTPPYSQELFTNLGEGFFELLISDANGCEASTTFNLTAPPQIEIDAVISSFDGFGVLCNGDSNGSIDINSVTGGSGEGYTFDWLTGESEQNIINLEAGIYSVIVTDSEGCQEDFDFEITEPEAVALEITQSDYNGFGVSCFGSSDGFIEVNASGGNGIYTYFWSNSTTTQEVTDVSGLLLFDTPADMYSILVADSNGCVSEEIEVEITEPSEMIISEAYSDYSGYGVSCNGENDGFIDVTITGGVGLYTYVWSNGADTEDVSDLVAGLYSATVTDENGCEATISVEITEPAIIDIVLDSNSITELACGTDLGSLNVSVTGGLESYSYSWSNGEAIEDIVDLTIGSYTLVVTDFYGCVNEETFNIDSSGGLLVSEPIITYCNNFDDPNTELVECSGEMIIEDISEGVGGYEILLTNPDGTTELFNEAIDISSFALNNLCNGDYSVSVSDDSDCVITYDFSVFFGEIQDLIVDVFNNGILVENGEIGFCSGDVSSVSVSPVGGGGNYTYSWVENSSGNVILVNSPVISFTGEGSFSVFTTSDAGCVVENVLNVVELENLNVNTGLDALCPGQDSYLYVIGEPSGGESPYFYEWYYDSDDNGLDQTLDPLVDSGPDATFIGVSNFGNYYLIVTDVNGCSVTQSQTLNWSLDIGLDVDSSSTACYSSCDGQITFVPDESSNAFSFDDWSLYYSIADIDGDGINNLDENGNILDLDIDGDGVLNQDDPDIDGDGVLNELDDLTSISAYSILMESLSLSIDSLCPGDYYLIGLSNIGDGCETLLEFFQIQEYDDLIIDSILISNISCFSDSDGDVDIYFSADSLLNQTYTLSVGGVVIQSGDASSPINASNLDIGEYLISITNDCGSLDSLFTITQPDELVVQLDSAFTDLLCFGDNDGFIELTTNGGVPPYQYLWSNGLDTEDVFNLEAGVYTLTVVDDTGCQEIFTQEVFNPDEFSVSFEYENVLCYGDENGFIDLTVLGPGTFLYSWSNGSTSEDLINLSPGVYTVDVISEIGCGEQTLQFEITEPDPIVVIVDDVQSSSCFSFSFNNASIDITVIGGAGDYTYNWTKEDSSFQSFEEDLDELSAGFYSLIVTDSDGCIFEYPDQIQITEPTPIEFFEDLDQNGEINSSFSFTQYVCANTCDGQISFDVNAGVPPFNYELVNDLGELVFSTNNGLFNGLCAGCYTVNIYDANWDETTSIDCITSVDICIDESEPLISGIIIPAGCGIDGLAEFEFPGGFPPYDIMLSLDNTLFAEELNYSLDNFSYENLPSGSYEFMVEDSVGCVDVFSFELENILNEMEIIDIDVINPSCNNEFGLVSVEFVNSYNPDLFNPFGLVSIAQDINGDCVFNSNEVIVQEFTIDNTFELNMSFDIQNLSGGNYVMLIEDNFGCFISECFSINTILEPNPDDFFASVDAICTEASGSAYVSGDPLDVGGTPFDNEPYYDVLWFDSDGNPVNTVSPDALIASSLYAGDYVVVITDANNCVFEHEFTIEEPESLLFSGVSYSDVNCNSVCDGEIIIQPYGGEGDYYTIIITPFGGNSFAPEVLVPGVNDTYILSNVCAGDYEIEISDGVCPIIFENITIEQPSAIDWTVVTNPLPCNGDVILWSDPDVIGSNYYVYSGDTGPADLYWYPNSQNCNNLNTSNALDINNLGAGNYYLYSIDANGCCTPQGQHLIPETPILESDFNPFDSELWIYCPGDNTGLIAINTYGGTPSDGPYTYLWNYNGEYLPEYDNMNVVENLSTGEYQVTVNDENGCGPIIHTIFIAESDPIEFYVQNQSDYNGYGISCNGNSDGFININTNTPSNYSYSWITVDSDNNIIAESDYSMNINYIYNWIGVDANDNFIDLLGQSDNEDLNNLPAGNYTFSIQVDIPEDESFISSCEYSGVVVVSEPSVLEVVSINTSDISCNGLEDGVIDITINGGVPPYDFLWSNGLQTEDLSDLGAGNYSLTVIDENGCELILDPIVLTEPNPFIANLPSDETIITNANCAFGNTESGQISIHLDALFAQVSGGTEPYGNPFLTETNGVFVQSGSVNGDSIFFSDLPGGEYDVHIVDALGCDLSFGVDVGINNEEAIELGVVTDDADCGFNGSVLVNSIANINGIPPYSIIVSSVSNPGFSYEFEVYDGFDYNSNDWNNNGIPDYDPDVDGDGYLNNEDGDIDGDGVFNYIDDTMYGEEGEDVDQDGVLNFDVDYSGADYGLYESAPPGEYEVFVTDAVGCIGFAGPFFVNEAIPDFAVLTEPGNCYWELNNSCDSLSNNGSILIDPNSFVPNTIFPYSIFVDGELYDTVDDWGDVNTNYVIPNLEAGTAYSIALTDGNGCVFENNGHYYEVPFLSDFNVDIVGFCPECQESSNGGFAYTFLGVSDEVLYGGDPNSYEIYSPPVSYDDNISIDILYAQNNVLDCLPDTNALDTIQFDNNLINVEDFYFVNDEWLNNIPDPNVLVDYHQEYLQLLEDTTDYSIGGLSYGTYYITMIDEYGCQFTEQIDISDENCKLEFGSQQWDNCLFIPSVFTPNADGINDFWDIYNIELYEPGVNVKIFNRWGQIVYENKDNEYSNNLWDGINMDGNNVEIATYYYVVEVDVDNEQKKYTGYVVVKR
ncbi:MAG: hypothetical protein CMP56_02645 [Flavobacteriales bacterium]|nr:hypothetical protein [Flavobacteriales bacterium]